jgi:hypothetical protein
MTFIEKTPESPWLQPKPSEDSQRRRSCPKRAARHQRAQSFESLRALKTLNAFQNKPNPAAMGFLTFAL